MAIIIGQNEKKSNLFSIIGWIIFLAIAGAAVYYVFFAQPELVAIPAAGRLGTIATITQISLHPDTVVQSAAFEALISTIPLPATSSPALVGRPDPFIAP